MRLLTTFITLLFFGLGQISAQNTFVYFHNNTDLDFSVSTTGNPPPEPADWDGYNGNIVSLQPHLQMMRLYRDWGTSDSPVGIYYLTTTLTFPTGETVDIKIEYDVEEYDFFSNPVPRINFRHSADGPGFSHPWRDDRTVYDAPFTINGVNYFLRYQSYSTVPAGTYDDVLYSIYKEGDIPYTVDSADAANPNILNVMSYNVFMRPMELFPNDDQDTRADHIADYVHDMDAIILQEVFDNGTRATLLANLAAEYPYQSSVVDEPSNALEDGGVVIVSKWPIEVEDQYLWGDTCHEDDCLSNKGVKYVRIDKLGKKYHLFGTHMDAFNEQEDIDTRKQQLVDWRTYIDSKSIPADEAVIMGGDYNIDKFANKQGEYDSLWGDFGAQLPIYVGNYSTWDPEFNLYNLGEPYDPEYLDYVLNNVDYRQATSNTHNALMMRSNHIDMWRIFDLSDHQPIWSRFIFPEPCTYPSNIMVDLGNDPNKVTVSWDPVPGAIKYQLRYRRAGTTTWTNLITTGTSRVITGLTQNKVHDYRVRTMCADGTWSEMSPIDKFRNVVCKAPLNLTSIILDDTKVRVEWDQYQYADKYQIFYREAGSNNSWSSMVTYFLGMNYRVLNGLTPGIQYEYKVRSWCEVSYGPFTDLHYFTTPLARGAFDNESISNHKLYPNPISSNRTMTLEFESESVFELQGEILDMNGRSIQRLNYSSDQGTNLFEFGISDWPEGIYIIRLFDEKGNISIQDKIVVR